MMKKMIALLLVIFTVCTAIPAVALTPEEKETVGVAEAEDNTLPSACTLVGTRDLPPVDNQGGVGCCASNAIAYTQFTNAVSRFLNAASPAIDWNPSSGEKKFLFSPKYTYTYSGAGTAWVYDVLQDNGCLTQTDSGFYKAADGGSLYRVNGQLVKKAVKWDVENDLMQKALGFRITGYDQVWVTRDEYCDPALPTYHGEKNVALTKIENGRALLTRIKDSINRGNVVVTGGMVARWTFGSLTANGTIGKQGDKAIIAALGTAGGGHQVAVVGYDDEIECTISGYTMKGGFQIVNSWGEGWGDGGYAWLMYDALNTLSEIEQFNEDGFYSTDMFLDTDLSGNVIMNPAFAASGEQTATFKRVATTNVNGTIYKVYTIYSAALGGYLAYSQDDSDTTVHVQKTADKSCYWAMIPYADLSEWQQFGKSNYNEAYLGSYWLYAVNRVTGNFSGYKFLDAGLSYESMGRGVGIASLSSGAYPQAKSWYVEPDASLAEKQSPIGIFAGRGGSLSRTWSMDQFCFLDWENDVTAEMPELYVKLEVSTTNREAVYATMYRKPLNSGTTTTQIPAIFQYGSSGYHPDYDSFKWTTKDGGTMTFSGEENSTTPERASLYLSFSDLLYNLPEGKNFTDYAWGFSLSAYRCTPVTLHSAQLLNQKGEVLDTLKLPAEGLTLTPSTTSMSSKKTSSVYLFDLPDEVNSYEVALTATTGLTVTPPDRSYSMGERYTFKVEAPKGCKAEQLTVCKDGVPLLGKDGIYTTIIAGDHEITVRAELTEDQTGIFGDLNEDGLVSIQDVTTLLLYLSDNDYRDPRYDINKDSIISIQDVTALLLVLAA